MEVRLCVYLYLYVLAEGRALQWEGAGLAQGMEAGAW